MNDRSNERLEASGLSGADAIAFRVLGVLAAAGAALAVAAGIPGVIDLIAGGTITLPLMLAEPVTQQMSDRAIVTAQTEELMVTAGTVSAGLRATLAVGTTIGALVTIIVGAVIAMFLWRLAQGQPFHRSLVAASLVAGVAMSLGGLIGASAVGISTMQLAIELDPDGDVFVPGFSFDPTLMFAGFLVLALAFVFRAGTRLQRETEGPV